MMIIQISYNIAFWSLVLLITVLLVLFSIYLLIFSNRYFNINKLTIDPIDYGYAEKTVDFISENISKPIEKRLYANKKTNVLLFINESLILLILLLGIIALLINGVAISVEPKYIYPNIDETYDLKPIIEDSNVYMLNDRIVAADNNGKESVIYLKNKSDNFNYEINYINNNAKPKLIKSIGKINDEVKQYKFLWLINIKNENTEPIKYNILIPDHKN